MRIAHLADCHLGLRRYYTTTPGGHNRREMDAARSFSAAITQIIAAAPDAVVIAGDVFNAVRPPNGAVVFALREFRRLHEALPACPIVLCGGNHDTPRTVESGCVLPALEQVGVHVAAMHATRFRFPDLEILAVPHAALAAKSAGSLVPEGPERHHVMVVHGEIRGVSPGTDRTSEEGAQVLDQADLNAHAWGYVALGDYHVQQEVEPMVWYSGATDYVSSDIWREQRTELERGQDGKAWLLVDLDAATVTRQPIPRTCRIVDPDPIDARDLTAEELAARITALVADAGDLTDTIMRVRVLDITVPIQRDASRLIPEKRWRYDALHFQVSYKRPQRQSVIAKHFGKGRASLLDIFAERMDQREMTPGVDREVVKKMGLALLAEHFKDDDYCGGPREQASA